MRARQTESFFNTVKSNAAMVGLSVNEKKTQVLCISASNHSNNSAYVRMEDGTKIQSQEQLCQLGFIFGTRPNMDRNMDHLATKFRKRLWLLRHLKKAGIPQDDLLQMYKCFLLSVLDFGSVVYHSMVTNGQKHELERLQAAALKIIYGRARSHNQLMQSLEGRLEFLEDRRQRMVDKFILKTADNENYRERWFPTRQITSHNLRTDTYYLEENARTNRLFNAPIFYYRRRLNQIRRPADRR